MAHLVLRFTHSSANVVSLHTTEFTHPSLPSQVKTTYGTGDGEFLWREGLQALCVYLLTVAKSAAARGEQNPPELCGGKGTIAASVFRVLDQANRARNPVRWVRDMFGTTQSGGAFLREMVLHRKLSSHPEQFAVGLRLEVLPAASIEVYVDGEQRSTTADLGEIASNVENQWYGKGRVKALTHNDAALLAQEADDESLLRPIRDEKEFKDFWALDQRAYADAPADYAQEMERVLRDWWKAYPAGLLGRFRGREVIGGVGVWPVGRGTADGLCTGTVRERDISPEEMKSYTDRPTSYWYLGGLLVRNDLVGSTTAGRSLTDWLHPWCAHCSRSITWPVTLIAQGASSRGISSLKRFGFVKVLEGKRSEDAMPVYRVQVTSLDAAVDIAAKRRGKRPR